MKLAATLKYNRFHDERGRFSTRERDASGMGGGSGGGMWGFDPKAVIREHNRKQKAYEKKNGHNGIRWDTDLSLKPMPIEQARGLVKVGGGRLGDFVLQQGEEFSVPAEAPPMKLGKMKECFTNAGQEVLFGRDLEYVEGFVVKSDLPIPVHHAWYVRKGSNEVIDPTLGWSPGATYIGVRMSAEFLRKKILENKVWGVFVGPGDMFTKLVRGTDPDFKYKP